MPFNIRAIQSGLGGLLKQLRFQSSDAGCVDIGLQSQHPGGYGRWSYVCSRQTWSTGWALGQWGLYCENLSQKRSIGSKRTKEDARACAGVCVGGQDMQPSVDRDGLMHWPIPSWHPLVFFHQLSSVLKIWVLSLAPLVSVLTSVEIFLNKVFLAVKTK